MAENTKALSMLVYDNLRVAPDFCVCGSLPLCMQIVIITAQSHAAERHIFQGKMRSNPVRNTWCSFFTSGVQSAADQNVWGYEETLSHGRMWEREFVF
jgi:hypothetical protein